MYASGTVCNQTDDGEGAGLGGKILQKLHPKKLRRVFQFCLKMA